MREYFKNLTKIQIIEWVIGSLYSMVAIVSVGHMTSTLGISDGAFFTLLYSLSLILGISGLIMARAFYKINGIYNVLYFTLFIVITLMEFLGNSNHIYTSIEEDNAFFVGYTELYNIGGDETMRIQVLKLAQLNTADSLVVDKLNIASEIKYREEEVTKYQKRSLAFTLSSIIVFLGMGFISMLLYFWKQDKIDNNEAENDKNKIIKDTELRISKQFDVKIIELEKQFVATTAENYAKWQVEMNEKESKYTATINKANLVVVKLEKSIEEIQSQKEKERNSKVEVFEFINNHEI